MKSSTSMIRLTITLPIDVAAEVKQVTSKRSVSSFISQAIKNEINRKKRESAFKKLEKLPPASPEITDPVSHIKKLRTVGEDRLLRETA